MSRDRTDLLERFAPLFDPSEPSFERFLRRRDRKRRNQRVTAGVVGMGVFVAVVWFVTIAGPPDRSQTPVTPGGAETGPVSAAAGTRVTFHDKRVPFGRARLWGIVESERPLKCARGREVVVFRQRGSEQDPKTDLEVAHDTASLRLIGDHYKWNLILSGPPYDGPHYARVKKTESCRADTSRTFNVAFGGG